MTYRKDFQQSFHVKLSDTKGDSKNGWDYNENKEESEEDSQGDAQKVDNQAVKRQQQKHGGGSRQAEGPPPQEQTTAFTMSSQTTPAREQKQGSRGRPAPFQSSHHSGSWRESLGVDKSKKGAAGDGFQMLDLHKRLTLRPDQSSVRSKSSLSFCKSEQWGRNLCAATFKLLPEVVLFFFFLLKCF